VPAFDGPQSSHTIETAASRCLEILRRFRPHGPYVLGGWCVFGVIAFEMARILEAEGADVKLLVMLDARDVLSTSIRRQRARQRVRLLLKHLRRPGILWQASLKRLWRISYKIYAAIG